MPILLAGLTAVGPFTIDTAFPAFSAIGRDFGASTAELQLIVSAYLLSFALMSVVHGPLSDAVGRRPVIIGGLLMYAVASVGCALAVNLPMLLGFRCLQGLSAGGGVIVARTVIRDVHDGAIAQRLTAQVSMIFGIAPAVAPIVGGLLLQIGPWQGIFWFLTGLGLVLAAAAALLLPETHPVERRVAFSLRSMSQGLLSVGRSGEFHRVAWATAFGFGGQFLYIGAASIFVVDLLHQGETDFWKFFLPMIASMMVGSFVSSRSAGRWSEQRLVTFGLGFAVAAAVLNLGLGHLSSADTLPQAVVGPSLIAFGIGCAYPSLQLAILEPFPRARGAAASLGAFLALTLNAVVAALIAPRITVSVGTLALGALVLVSLGLGCWLWHVVATGGSRPTR